MGLNSDVVSGVRGVLAPEWQRRKGQVVPESDDITLRDGAVDLDATYLYADMADSTGLAQGYKDFAVAKVIRCYLNAASKIIRTHGGSIRSFDGDRVMGIFIGDSQAASAVKAAMQISWAVSKVVNPQLQAKWKDFKWTMKHGVGIDTGQAMLVRGGVHGNNDIVSVGHAPNIAAKLSELRSMTIHIGASTYGLLNDNTKYSKGKEMWSDRGFVTFGGKVLKHYGSDYYWIPS